MLYAAPNITHSCAIKVNEKLQKILRFCTLNISFTYFPRFNHHLQEVRVQNQYVLRWLTHGKYVTEMFKVHSLKILCYFPLTSMGHEWVMFCAVILMFLVMIFALVVLLAHIIIQTDEN